MRKFPTILFFVAFAAFIAVRLWTAWLLRFECNGDLAIVQLMVRRMLAGEGWPVFFYGQAYMGSLEPTVSAMFAALFGESPFVIALGTILFSCLAMWFLARLAWKVGGAWCAALLTALMIFPPASITHYLVSPRGGYGVLFFVTFALLERSVALVENAADFLKSPKRAKGTLRLGAQGFTLGILAGVGFWCNQLTAPAVAAAAFLILCCAPRLLLRPALWLGGILGFAAGSAPYWIWNAMNAWQSLEMGGSVNLAPQSIARNVYFLISSRWALLWGFSGDALWIKIAVIFASLVPFLLALRRRPSRGLLAVWFYAAMLLACFSVSYFATFKTPRYLLTLIPVVFLFLAAGFLRERKGAISAALCTVAAVGILVLALWEFSQFKDFRAMAAKHRPRWERYEKVAAFCNEQKADAALSAFLMNSLNVVTNGECVFTDPRNERIDAFNERRINAKRLIILENIAGIATWARNVGSCKTKSIDGIRVAYDLKPPQPAVEIGNDEIAEILNDRGENVRDLLLDGKLEPQLLLTADSAGKARLRIKLRRPVKICGVNILSFGDTFCRDLECEGMLVPFSPARWENDRLVLEKDNPLQSIRFSPRERDELEIIFTLPVNNLTTAIHELRLLAPVEDGAQAAEITKSVEMNIPKYVPTPNNLLGAEVNFKGGEYTWRGCEILSQTEKEIVIRHHWSARSIPELSEKTTCFVHFIGPRGFRFGDDHPFPNERWLYVHFQSGMSFARQWSTDRHVRIPPEAPAGVYRMQIGLYNMQYSMRFPASSSLRIRRRAAEVNPLFILMNDKNPPAGE